MHTIATQSPSEVFPMWLRAQLVVGDHAREIAPPPAVLRTRTFLDNDAAERVAGWFTAEPAPPTEAVRRSYAALERETARLFSVIRRGLGVHVSYVAADAYESAADLCAELRACASMTLTTIASEDPHPLLGGERGGVVDQLRVVHDVFGHAALGLGFDLQSEFATWLQCRTLFSREAQPAAFTELVGAVTAYVMTGTKPGLVAKLPPRELLERHTVISMRVWLIIGALVVAALAVVVIPQLGSDDPHTPRPGHAETLPAAVALVYARGVQVSDETIACGTMTKDAAQAVGCGSAKTNLRACGDFSVRTTLILDYGRSRAAIQVGNCRIDLVPGKETGWAVSKVTPA